MAPPGKSLSFNSRRDILKSGALAVLPLAIHSANLAPRDQQPMTANGGTDPYPIPWLDKRQPQSARRLEPRTFAYLPFQRSSRSLQHIHAHWHGQSRKPDRFWQSYD